MKINKLKINSYGKLQNKEINLGKKINIIYGENESGKSTILKFILNSFYGTSKNKKGKDISDYEQYKPWNTDEFSGKLEYELDNGETFEIYREFSKKNPKIFNIKLEDISKQFNIDKNKGNEFFYEQTKIDEELFLATSAILQEEVRLEKNTQNNLIQKITNIVGTGSDNVSYKRAIERLNRRQLDEVGSDRTREKPINLIEQKINNLKNKKEEIKKYDNIRLEINLEKEKIKNNIFENKIKYEIIKKINEIKINEKIENEKINIKEKIKKENLEKINNIKNKIEEIKKLENKKIKNNNQEKNKLNKKIIIIFLILILINILWYFLINKNIENKIIKNSFILTVPIFLIFLNFFKKYKNNKINNKNNEENKIINNLNNEIKILEKNINEIENEIEKNKLENNSKINLEKNKIKNNYYKKINNYELNNLLNNYLENGDEKINNYKSDNLLNNNLENEEEKINKKINEEELKLHKINIEEKDIEEKYNELLNIEENLSVAEEKYNELKNLNDSINLAKEIILNSYEKMQNNVSPKLTEQLSKNISEITNGKYNKVKFDDEKGMIVEIENGNYISAERLSSGTIDQLYLSLRLAVLDSITEEKIPIILDEVFSHFDDTRLKNILNYINNKFNDRQLIIFTCNDREITILKNLEINYNLIKL